MREVHGLDPIEREDTSPPEPLSEPVDEADEDDEAEVGAGEGEQEDASEASSGPEAEAS